ncbi:MAG: DUF1080 domain-containing protein [Sphingobacteriales bacterium]|nr:MAG: DUF1080 domain-containing protein [Sphingobacteriales bacterium]
MKRWLSFVCLVVLFQKTMAQAAVAPAVEGRWDITVYDDNKLHPSWLEINHSGHSQLVGQYVGIVGSARPISKITYSNNTISFTIPPQWERETTDLQFEAKLQGDSLQGSFIAANGKTFQWSAHRAPSLKRTTPVVWGKPIALFNGKDLNGWNALGKNQWVVKEGILTSPQSGANLMSTATFTDFKLLVEFKYPKGSNSGIYLRGRYEVQIEDGFGTEALKDRFGGVYGFIKPTDMMAKPAGEWQRYEITLTGRLVTIIANGKTIVCNQEIPGITGGALDSKEEMPGPIYIQGDHGPIMFRKIVITPAK